MQSIARRNQLNLPHRTETKPEMVKKWWAARVHCVSLGERERTYGGKDLWKRYVLSWEWKSKGVMDDDSGEFMERAELVSVGRSEYKMERRHEAVEEKQGVDSLCHLFRVSLSLSTLYLELNVTHPSDHSYLCPLKYLLIFFPCGPDLTSMQLTTSHIAGVQSPSHNQWHIHIDEQWY